MRVRSLALLTASLAIAVPVTAAQAGSSTDRATGGGQTLVSTDGGAGNTIAFTAQGTEETVKGQVQVVEREAGTGRSQVKFHGVVTCLRVEGNMAEIGGVERDGEGTFNLRVVDNGEGSMADDDMIQFDRVTGDPSCTDDSSDDGEPEFDLARGNAQVHDAE